MDTVETNPEAAARRSTRIRAQIPLRIVSLDPAVEFSENCQTLVVNTQGCGVRLDSKLETGTRVQLELATGQSATAFVANSVPLGSDGKFHLVGIALEEPGNIWGLFPCPPDWGEPKALAKAPDAALMAATDSKRNEWPYSQFSSRGEFHPGRK
jgi:hypothetical protein